MNVEKPFGNPKKSVIQAKKRIPAWDVEFFKHISVSSVLFLIPLLSAEYLCQSGTQLGPRYTVAQKESGEALLGLCYSLCF
jgi:hypothetical protein